MRTGGFLGAPDDCGRLPPELRDERSRELWRRSGVSEPGARPSWPELGPGLSGRSLPMRSLGCRECCDMLSTGSQVLVDYRGERLCPGANG